MECAERACWTRRGCGSATDRPAAGAGRDRRRRGLGALLAEGSRRAAERRGRRLRDFALHVKGLELPGYEPRTLQAMALGLAVNARGADHNRSGAYEADLSGDARPARRRARRTSLAAVETEDRAAVMDSLILCKFLRGVFTDPFPSGRPLLRPVTGWDVDARRAARHGRAGSSWPSACSTCARAGCRADDWLPARLLQEPLTLGSGRVATLSAASAARHGRRLLGRPWPRRAGASAQRGRRRRPACWVSWL